MVAIITPAHSMRRIFNYNENKVKEGVAECIGAENYPLLAEEMSNKMKLNLLLKRNELNENVKRNSIHISLNFDTSEIGFPKEKLMQIATTYMEKIGFGEQPYLVYQHHDAGHPHIHLVTSNIRADGSRIDLHHLGIRKSEPARKEIERIFDLVVAEGRREKQPAKLERIVSGRITYGKVQSKKALSSVLRVVLETYKYTSLPELNAVLRQYNVMADRGSEDSRIFKGGGLVYRILDDKGRPVGVPIKASDFYSKPTLKLLEGKFDKNDRDRIAFKSRIKNAIDSSFMDDKVTLNVLVAALEKKAIHTALRQNEAGQIYGITYVDHQTKCVFNGSALGKIYSAKGILERCHTIIPSKQNLLSNSAQHQIGLQSKDGAFLTETKTVSSILEANQTTGTTGLIETLIEPEHASEYVSSQFKRGKRKKRKRNNPNNNQ